MFYNRPHDFALAVVASLVFSYIDPLELMEPIGTLLALSKAMVKE